MTGYNVDWDDKWIRDNVMSYNSYQDMVKDYNKLHGTDIGFCALKNHAHYKLGINKPRLTYKHYTEEQIEFLKENYPKYGQKVTLQMFNEKFNENRTMSSMKNFGVKYGLKVEHAVRVENRQRSRRKPVGSTRWECGRFVMKEDDGNWEQASRVMYKKYHGAIPDGCSVIYLDGNQENLSKDNLMAVSPFVLGTLMKHNMRSENQEMTRTGVVWSQLREELIKRGVAKRRERIR